jgi:hypothetical protein
MISNILFIDENGKWDFGKSEIAGFIAMILSLSTIIIAVKQYRDNEKGGYISFKEAFLSGFYIVLVASTIYVVGWMIYYPSIAQEFNEQYIAQQLEKYAADGLSAEEMATATTDLSRQMEMYKDPMIRIGFTFLEIFPIGLVFALVAGLIWRKSTKKGGG